MLALFYHFFMSWIFCTWFFYNAHMSFNSVAFDSVANGFQS